MTRATEIIRGRFTKLILLSRRRMKLCIYDRGNYEAVCKVVDDLIIGDNFLTKAVPT